LQYRDELKNKKLQMKTLTLSINSTKSEMDQVEKRLSHKQDEKKAAHQRG